MVGEKIKVENGQKFGLLTVKNEAERFTQPSGQTARAFLCVCECGNETVVRLSHLVRGNTLSCGCLNGEAHGETGNPLHNIWRGMRNRCNRNSYIDHHRYKDRGIKVCPEWNKSYVTFKKWAEANGFKEGLQIDRINNDGNYEPKNCRFVTPSENVNNRSTTRFLNYHGVKRAFTDVMREKGIPDSQHDTIRGRIGRGWNHTEAVDKPIRKGNWRPDLLRGTP